MSEPEEEKARHRKLKTKQGRKEENEEDEKKEKQLICDDGGHKNESIPRLSVTRICNCRSRSKTSLYNTFRLNQFSGFSSFPRPET